MTWAIDLNVREGARRLARSSRGVAGCAPFLSVVLAAATAAAAFGLAGPVLAEATTELSSLPLFEPLPPLTGTPRVLTDDDVARYAKIFRLQRKGDWEAADHEIAGLKNRVLIGHVRFQRYMHPTAYRSRYDELKDWLDHYADLPEAARVYRLALRRQPKGAPLPKEPTGIELFLGTLSESGGVGDASSRRPSLDLSEHERRALADIDLHVGKGKPDAALHELGIVHKRRALSERAYDAALSRIATGYFFEGKDEEALALASQSAERSRLFIEAADWVAGLAAWRLRQLSRAQYHFEALARSKTASLWKVSAGGYWAARSYLVDRQPRKVNPMLTLAAAHPRTFYGLLAARWLDQHVDFDWDRPPVTQSEILELMRTPAIKRVIALAQVGRHDLADLELRGIYLSGREALGTALVGLANRLQIPATQLRLAKSYFNAGGPTFDAALFPMPPWQPAGGYQVDRALIFALMRQESGFDVKAKSQAGARGLMQLMPATASFVANDASLVGHGKDKLLAPEYNIEIAQRYLDYLLNDRNVRGNLIYLVVAYNSGPGKLARWLKTLKHDNDPLLFMESIPSRETRFFIERVLTNFWIYRARLRQDTPSLDAIAAGLWPYYLNLDRDELEMAQTDGRN